MTGWSASGSQLMDNTELARQLDQKYRGRYMVEWSCWTQTFLAWPTWLAARGDAIESADPQDLEARMVEQEKQLGIQPL